MGSLIVKYSAYELLGLNLDASKEEIKMSYQQLKEDIALSNDYLITKNEELTRVEEAYQLLMDDDLRYQYDRSIDEIQKEQIENNFAHYQQALNMFLSLKDYIGKEVEIVYSWEDGKDKSSGPLLSVENFSSVSIPGLRLDFLSYHSAISSIKDMKTNKMFYYNPYVPFAYRPHDLEYLTEIKKQSWGEVVANRQKREVERQKELLSKKKEYEDARAIAKRERLMKEGLPYVHPKLKKEWTNWVENHIMNAETCLEVELSLFIMKHLSLGADYSIIDTIVTDMNYTPYLMGYTASVVSHFDRQGKLFDQYWKSRFGIDDFENKKQKKPRFIFVKR